MLSDIQIKILTKFINAEHLRYSEAVPEGVDNDLFKYHLKFLIEKDYIRKTETGYELTNSGRRLGNGISLLHGPTTPFYVSVMDIVEDKTQKIPRFIIQKRKKHPDYGIYQPICGKIHVGESILDAAKRKLIEESGLIGEFTYLGMFRAIRSITDGTIVQDQWFNVCYCDNFHGDLKPDPIHGTLEFVTEKEMEKLKEGNLPIRNLFDILDLYRKKAIPLLIEDRATVTA